MRCWAEVLGLWLLVCPVVMMTEEVNSKVAVPGVPPWSVEGCPWPKDHHENPISLYNPHLFNLKEMHDLTPNRQGIQVFWFLYQGGHLDTDTPCDIQYGTLYQVSLKNGNRPARYNFTFTPPEPHRPLYCRSDLLILQRGYHGYISCAEERSEVVRGVEQWWSSLPFAHTTAVVVSVVVAVGVLSLAAVVLWVRRKRRGRGGASIT